MNKYIPDFSSIGVPIGRVRQSSDLMVQDLGTKSLGDPRVYFVELESRMHPDSRH